MRYLIISLIFLILFCGRFGPARKSQETQSQSHEDPANQELFDPERLPDTFIVEPPAYETYKKVQSGEFRPGALELTPDSVDVDSTLSIPGYRVQIFTSTSFIRAEEAYLNALAAIIDEPIYKIFDPPFYKVRVGNFIHREDALIYNIQKLKKIFPDSWIIQSRIFPYQRAPRILLDDSLLYPDESRIFIDTIQVQSDSSDFR